MVDELGLSRRQTASTYLSQPRRVAPGFVDVDVAPAGPVAVRSRSMRVRSFGLRCLPIGASVAADLDGWMPRMCWTALAAVCATVASAVWRWAGTSSCVATATMVRA